MKKLRNKLLTTIISWAVIIVAVWFGWTKLSAWANKTFSWSLPELTFGILQPDPVLGYNSDEIISVITTGSRQKAELIVYEVDVKVDSEVTNELLNISWFKKTQAVHSYGTGIYVVDLAQLDAAMVTVDQTNRIITVTVPDVKLKTVNYDITKTEFDDIERGPLGWGDIKLTQQQQQVLQTDIQQAMEAECSKPAYLEAARASASDQLTALYKSLLTGLDEKAVINIIYQ